MLSALEKATTPLSAEEIYECLSKEREVNLSTVYRNLARFEKDGLVSRESGDKKQGYYTLIRTDHRHILECKRCKKKIYLEECPFHALNNSIRKKTGFTLDDQNIVLYGLCDLCSKKSTS
jgi:Fur family ferric uptake transcriptional regulator